MHKRLLLASLLTTVLLTGCFPSIGPFYKEGQPFFDPELLGRWEPNEEEDETFVVETDLLAGKNAYRITAYDDEEVQYVLVGNLFKFGDMTLLDVTINDKAWEAAGASHPVYGRPLFRELTAPIHQLYRVERTESELKLFSGDTDWLKEQLADQPRKLQHFQLADILTFSDILLTDTPGRLQAFLSKHSQEAFESEPSLYTRVPNHQAQSR